MNEFSEISIIRRVLAKIERSGSFVSLFLEAISFERILYSSSKRDGSSVNSLPLKSACTGFLG